MESEKWSQLHHAEIFISKFMKQMDKEKIEVTFGNLYADIVIELMWIDADTKQETSIAMLQPQSTTELITREDHRFLMRLAGREDAVLRTIVVSKFDIAKRAYIAKERGQPFVTFKVEPGVTYDPNENVKIPFDVTNERDVMITLWVLAGKTPIKIATIRSHETMTFEGHDKYAYIATPFKHYSIDKHEDSIEILDGFELNLADYILKRNVSWVVADNGGVSYSGI